MRKKWKQAVWSTMEKEEQANLLTHKVVKKMYPACMLYALVMNMTFMVDTIIGGNFLGTEAVAAVAIGLPVIGMMVSCTVVIIQGCFLKLVKCMGRGDKEEGSRIYSIGVFSCLVMGIAFIVIAVVFARPLALICGGAKAAGNAMTYAVLYIKTASGMVLFFGLGSIFQCVLACYGYQRERMLCSAINIVINVLVSILAVKMLPVSYQIVGLGIGSALAAVAQLVAAAVYLRRRGIRVLPGIYAPTRENIVNMLDMIRIGIPSSVDNLLDSIVSSISNNLVLSLFSQGTTVLAIVAIVRSVHTVVKTAGKGAQFISQPLFGLYFNGRDVKGLKNHWQLH